MMNDVFTKLRKEKLECDIKKEDLNCIIKMTKRDDHGGTSHRQLISATIYKCINTILKKNVIICFRSLNFHSYPRRTAPVSQAGR